MSLMKQQNKINKIRFVLLFGLIFLPCIVFSHPVTDELLESYCTRILVFEVQNSTKVNSIETAYNDRVFTLMSDLEKERKSQDGELNKIKKRLDNSISKRLEKFNSPENSMLDEDKQKFIKKVNKVKEDYFTDIDHVIAQYRQGIDKEMSSRKQSFLSAKQTFNNKVAEILSKSKADCIAKSDVHTIFDQTTTNLKLAHEDFKVKIKELASIQGRLNNLSIERDTAMTESLDDFKAEIIDLNK